MDKKKILAQAGKVYYGIFSKEFEENVLQYVINNPKITKEELAFTSISTKMDTRARSTSKIRNEYVAQKFIDLVNK